MLHESPHKSLTRRRFLRQAGYSSAAIGLLGSFAARVEPQEANDASTAIAGKDRRLIVHNATPGEIETPLELLRAHRQTPQDLLFVRNNQTLPDAQTLKPGRLEGWAIDISGLVNRPQSFDAARLADLPQVEREIVLQCSGNGRAMFSRAAPCKGAPWTVGAMANVTFSGVPLSAVLEKLGVETQAAARFVAAEGRDLPSKPGEADFEHSLPLADVLERSILALKMNGEAIPAVHGGPVRLITPGYYGTMNVKWLSRLRFEDAESTNHHHRDRYRTPLEPIEPGSEFGYNLDNSEANWRMKIKSVIFAPLNGERLSAGRNEVRGVAFNDGAARIVAVEVSSDGGLTWRRAEIERPASPFAWHHWRIVLELPRGEQKVVARAVDALGRTQPLDGAIHWNPAGYAWNGVHEVTVQVGGRV